MGKVLRKTGKFYSGIMMDNIGIFIFVGLLSVLFQENGWFPNENMYAISQFVYKYFLPVCIAYMGGVKIEGHTGGVLAVLMTAGCVSANESVGILAGMLAAPVGGIAWKYAGMPLKRNAGSKMQMLAGNLLAGILGAVLAGIGYYIGAPVMELISAGLTGGVNYLVENGMLGALSLLVEPAKALFLNNIVNHGILVPMGMNQLMENGQSVLFLVETNPGPGLGLLLALYAVKKEKRDTYMAAAAAQAAGGLHEMYFPEVIANLWLLLPLMAAGMAGTEYFVRAGCGLQGPVSPGSVFTILLMAGREGWIKALVGILLSAGVSFAGSMLVLRVQRRPDLPTKTEDEPSGTETGEEERKEKGKGRMRIEKIGFVCDAGVGSSAMGAALFRRKLSQNGMSEGVRVDAYSSDRIPEDLDLIVCQKDFLKVISPENSVCEKYPVESLMGGEEFDRLILLIQKRNR